MLYAGKERKTIVMAETTRQVWGIKKYLFTPFFRAQSQDVPVLVVCPLCFTKGKPKISLKYLSFIEKSLMFPSHLSVELVDVRAGRSLLC